MPKIPCCCSQLAETSALCRRQDCHSRQGKARNTKISFGVGKWSSKWQQLPRDVKPTQQTKRWKAGIQATKCNDGRLIEKQRASPRILGAGTPGKAHKSNKSRDESIQIPKKCRRSAYLKAASATQVFYGAGTPKGSRGSGDHQNARGRNPLRNDNERTARETALEPNLVHRICIYNCIFTRQCIYQNIKPHLYISSKSYSGPFCQWVYE